MRTVYVTEQGATVGVAGGVLEVRAGREPVLSVHLAKVGQLVVMGNVTLTPGAVRRLLAGGIDTTILSEHGSYRGRLTGPESKNVPLRIEQVRAAIDPERCRAIAASVVAGKLANCRRMLMRYARRRGLDLSRRLHAIRMGVERLERGGAADLDQVRGVEGAGTAEYYRGLGLLLPPGFSFTVRTRRPPGDPVNALLSYGYTLLAAAMEGAVCTAGLDPYIGFLHAPAYGRPSLVMDLIEEFRPVIVDSLVLWILNTGVLSRNDFVVVEPQPGADTGDPGRLPVNLLPAARRRYIDEFQNRLGQLVTHPHTGQQVSWRRVLELQARELAAVIRGEREAYRPMPVR